MIVEYALKAQSKIIESITNRLILLKKIREKTVETIDNYRGPSDLEAKDKRKQKTTRNIPNVIFDFLTSSKSEKRLAVRRIIELISQLEGLLLIIIDKEIGRAHV